MRRSRESFESRGSADRLHAGGLTPSPPSGISLLENPYAASTSAESIPELSPATPREIDDVDEPPSTPATLLQSRTQRQAIDTISSSNSALDLTMLDAEDEFDDECDDDRRSLMSDADQDHSDGDSDSDTETEDGPDDVIAPNAIEFHVNRASVTRTGVIPCCVFVGRVTWGSIDWEIYFGHKQLLRLHLSMLGYLLYQKRRWLPPNVRLPWTLLREKRAEQRVLDVLLVQNYLRAALADDDLRNSDPLLSFLEVSPSRAMSRYGPSLKEGYVHMRMNGAFQLPLYTCVNRTIEAMYRHLYRTWMRIAFISSVVTFILPIGLIAVTTLPRYLTGQKRLLNGDGDVEQEIDAGQVVIGLITVAVLLFVAVFIYKFFDHRLGVIRRWVVLKPTCFAAYRRRADKEPSEVFLFDKTFSARKGSYRQGVSWMPSGFTVGSSAGFIEVDTGHYYTRLTMSAALGLVCWAIVSLSSSIYDLHPVVFPDAGVPFASINASARAWTNTTVDVDADGAVYCGYYFYTPPNATLHLASDDKDVVITTLQDAAANATTISTFQFFLGGDEIGYSVGLLSNNIGPNNLVAIAKKIDRETDRFLPSGYQVTAQPVGGFNLTGLSGTAGFQFSATSTLCVIPLQVAIFSIEAVGYYILMLLVGGVISATLGLALNYLISYLGLWHAHVRRDHWYRCVKRLQKLKRQDTEHRFKSFAPPRRTLLGAGAGGGEAGMEEEDETLLAPPLSTRTKASSDSSASTSSSFLPSAPPPNTIAWHVDGEDTYEAMYQAINDAKFEILIAGWWVTPDLYLRRPGRKLPPYAADNPKKTNETQLRNLLLTKAEQGVKIYVLIYREVKLALTLNSAYTKRSLMMHPNIRVLRDPIFQIQSLGFWSHHEKIVCVDQSIAFAGGLDLCFGRYDHSGHPLSDIGGANLEDQTWPGKDYSNPIIKDFVRVNKPFEDLVDRAQQPRMPWHDVHCSVTGPAVQDLAYHFIQRWNFVCSKNDYQLRTGWCICLRSRRFKLLPKCLLPMDFNGWTLRYPSSGTVAPSELPLERVDSAQIDVLDEPFPFRVMRLPQPFARVPGGGWGHVFTSHVGSMGVRSSPASGSSTSDLSIEKPPRRQQHRHHHNDDAIMPPGVAKPDELTRDQRCLSMVPIHHANGHPCHVQVCRSVCMWSAGVPTERSVHAAYLDVITRAEHYLYIENQFFVSGLHTNGVVSNRILQAIVDRVHRAVVQNQTFRVYVVMPLLPAFEGNIRSQELTNLHAVMHWQFASISRGGHSLFEALRKFTDTPEDYVAFFGLRKHGILPNGCVTTEQIYIHSKLLVADDKVAILGSANINDRSMTGDRDSEICLVIEDAVLEEGVMNAQPFRRGVAASSLRRQLFREHLGLAQDDATTIDPVSDATWLRIKQISAKNTSIFESVFDCAPSNRMTSFSSFVNLELTQIFENQRLNVLTKKSGHVWDAGNLKDGDYAPWTDVNGVPINVDKLNLESDFVVDRKDDEKRRKRLFLMDHDGWCYARNFAHFQEVRLHNFRKRDVLQHFVTDRLIAQVRRRRWVRKDSPAGQMLLFQQQQRASIESAGGGDSDNEDGTGRWASLWRRLHRSDSASQLNMSRAQSEFGHSLEASSAYPDSPSMSSFRRGPVTSPGERGERGRDSSLWHSTGGGAGGVNRSSTLGYAMHPMHSHAAARDSDLGRYSADSAKGGLGVSLKKWASFMDNPLDLGRRSRFTEEYFSKDKDDEVYGQTYVNDDQYGGLEAGGGTGGDRGGGGDRGRMSGRSVRSMDERATPMDKRSLDLGEGECQIGHLQTAATVRKEDEGKARGQLSEIRGHLVDFPLDFLKEEILQPSILPRDLHI